MNLFESNHLFFFLLLAHIIVMEIIAWFTISYFGNGWIPTLMTAFILATSQVRCDPSPAMQSPPLPPPAPWLEEAWVLMLGKPPWPSLPRPRLGGCSTITAISLFTRNPRGTTSSTSSSLAT